MEIPLLTYLTTTLVLRPESAALALWSYYKNVAALACVRREFHLILIMLCLPSKEDIIRIVIGRPGED